MNSLALEWPEAIKINQENTGVTFLYSDSMRGIRNCYFVIIMVQKHNTIRLISHLRLSECSNWKL